MVREGRFPLMSVAYLISSCTTSLENTRMEVSFCSGPAPFPLSGPWFSCIVLTRQGQLAIKEGLEVLSLQPSQSCHTEVLQQTEAMSSHLVVLLLVACSAVAVVSSGALSEYERSRIINDAIKEVKGYEASLQSSSHRKVSRAQKKVHGFKMSTPAAAAIGKASLRFERIVNIAENKIIQKQRLASQNSEAKAESLAFELLHRPGQLLTSQELAHIFSESECIEAVTVTQESCREFVNRFYRTPDGTCNNLRRQTLGAANTGLRRLIKARYDNGIFRARGFLQSSGSSLFRGPFAPPIPSARLVSTSVVLDKPIDDVNHTHILMQWGQFLDHDLDLVPEHEAEECPQGCRITEEEEASCYPIPVLEDDDQVEVTRAFPSSRGCEPFMRSMTVCPEEEPNFATGNIPPKEQINAITHFIDGSMIYHHNATIQRDLIRDTSSNAGLLRVSSPLPDTDQDLLPYINVTAYPRVVACPNEPCFLAGDVRVNEQTGLIVMHTIWVREHNRIARILKTLNPNYSGELLFLTARTIVSGMVQKITYEDFLPQILGSKLFDTLIPDYDGYDDSVDVRVPNAFATAAYRFGHSLIRPAFDRLDKDYNPIAAGPLSLLDAFFNVPAFIESNGTDSLLRGLISINARRVDEFLNEILTNRLFADDADTPGLDLASLNVQRGRDHGLPPYLAWRQWAEKTCGLHSDFRSDVTEVRLLQTYGGLENVDLFVGGLAEQPIEGGLVGATFACIFGKSFTALRDGDRFYYENVGAAGRFTRNQLTEIRKASLARVICDNSDTIHDVQRNVFLADQQRVPCSQIPSVNLNEWKVSNGICSVRVASDTTIDVLAISRRGSQFHYSEHYVSSNQATCVQFECPTSRADARLGVTALRASCRIIPNSNLPDSSNNLFYAATISEDLLQSRNGLHEDRSQCRGSSVVGLRFSCSESSSASSSSTSASTQSDDGIEVDANGKSELSTVVGDEGQKLLDYVSSSTDKKSEKTLISLMENVLAQLQETKKDEMKQETPSEKSVISQLEDYFKNN